MVTVALIGADGAGKTTLARTLEAAGELPIKYLYMGVNARASNHMLPTTRAWLALRRALGREEPQGGPPDPARLRARGGLERVVHEVRSTLSVAHRVCEEWYRVAVARRYERRGFIVLFDRHFYADYWAHDVSVSAHERSFARRLHGRWLARLPRPDRTILLDAPAEVLFARKAEGTLERIEQRRQEYLRLQRELGDCTVVDAARPPAEVREHVLGVLRELQARGRP